MSGSSQSLGKTEMNKSVWRQGIGAQLSAQSVKVIRCLIEHDHCVIKKRIN